MSKVKNTNSKKMGKLPYRASSFMVLVRTPEEPFHQAAGDRSLSGTALNYVEISTEALQSELRNFIVKMNGVLENVPQVVGQFNLDSLEFSVEITGKGSVGLLGTGGEVGATGGLTFVLKRKGS